MEKVLEFTDGFKIFKLVSNRSYKREGRRMNNCLASYTKANVNIFSLRTPQGQSVVNMEGLGEVRGHSNEPIEDKYMKYVIEFSNRFGVKFDFDCKNHKSMV